MAIGTGAAILGAAAIGGGTSMLAGSQQAEAAEGAGRLNYLAQMEAIKEQRRQFDQSRKDLAPFRETGVNALEQYGALYGVGQEGMLSEDDMQAARDRFMTTPGYDFRFNEGLRAMDRSAAARGQILGGGYGRQLQRYGQGVASQEFENYANRLAQLSSVGQTATGQGVSLGQQTAGTIGNIMMQGAAQQGNALMQAGTARASGYAGLANAATGAAGNYAMFNALKG